MSNILNTMVFFYNFAKNSQKVSEFNISIQPTKNPKIIKFVANTFLVQGESFEFKNIDEAKSSPLAQQLFYLPFVKTVYISQNFVALERFDIVEWEAVQEEVANSITTYLNAGNPIISDRQTAKKIAVSIYAESTPNPEALKFVANIPLVDGLFEFKNKKEAIPISPLAQSLFDFPFVKEVFISSNYVSIAKVATITWQEVVMELREFLKEYLEAGLPILTDEALNNMASHTSKDKMTPKNTLTDLEKEIVSILDEYVKPAVAGDGGHIAFESFDVESQTVRVLLQGACSGCPSSTVTLKNGIETMLKQMLPGKVSSVEAINA